MPENQIPETVEEHRNPRRNRTSSEPVVGRLLEPKPQHELSRLVLRASVLDEIEAALRSVMLREELERVWKLSHIQPQTGRCALNFYGPPGTGKTRAAQGISWRLGKPLYQVDYSAIVSKYLGDTAKHIVLAFKQAKEADAILFFDEADSLLSKRVASGESCSTSINQNRNCLMQELDQFNGMVILTTNLFGNYDEALLRRVARHVEFALPDAAMREKLFRSHLPNQERTPASLRPVALASKGLSGGDILNVCLNAMQRGSVDPDPANWRVSEELLLSEIRKVLNSKKAYRGNAALPSDAH